MREALGSIPAPKKKRQKKKTSPLNELVNNYFIVFTLH
jgi:hypothetical protein